MSLSARTPEIRAQNLLSLTQKLIGAINKQCELIKNNAYNSQDKSVEETQNLSSLYALEIHRLKKEPDALKGISEGLKQSLITHNKSLDETSKRFQSLSHAALKVSQGIIKALSQAEEKTTAPAQTYSKNGTQKMNNDILSIKYRF